MEDKIGLESLEEIMEFMDEHMVKKAMGRKKQPEVSAIMVQESDKPEAPKDMPEGDGELDVAQAVPMAEADDIDLDEDTLRMLIEKREKNEIV